MIYTEIIIGPIKQLIGLDDIPLRGALSNDAPSIASDCWLHLKDGIVQEIIFDQDSIPQGIEYLKLTGDYIALPGFIDAHTHICFHGTRARDYAMRNAGISYLEIAKAGGGIWDTVTQTRKASLTDLVEGILKRVEVLITKGITTIEVKSGYGLSVEEELKMLRAIKEANSKTEIDLIPTCLAAHIKPKDFEGNHAEYLDIIIDELFPIIVDEKLANRVDAFIEEEAFSAEVVYRYFTKARDLGFNITVHADQFHTGGSEVAIEHNALSADHLEASTETEIMALAKSETVAMALPGASIGLGCAFTPARKILDADGILAIASDWNPGSAPMGDLLTQACILGAFEKLSNPEVLAGITKRAAKALNLKDRGTISKGSKADLLLFEGDDYNEIFYHQGKKLPAVVFKNGKLIYKV